MFRIMPRVWEDEPVQRTFENAKQMMDAALLTLSVDIPISAAVAAGEVVLARKIPYMLRNDSTQTQPLWKKGRLDMEVTTFAQGQTFTLALQLCKKDTAPVALLSLPCVVAAGTKFYRSFSAFKDDVDFTLYDGILFMPTVGVAPAVADRYVVTVQLTFHPFAPFGKAA